MERVPAEGGDGILRTNIEYKYCLVFTKYSAILWNPSMWTLLHGDYHVGGLLVETVFLRC